MSDFMPRKKNPMGNIPGLPQSPMPPGDTSAWEELLAQMTGSPVDIPEPRRNVIFPDTGFFGRHNRLTSALENALLTVSMIEPGETTGENITNVARALIGAPRLKTQLQMEPVQQAIGQATQLGSMKMGLEEQQAKLEGIRAQTAADKAHADYWTRMPAEKGPQDRYENIFIGTDGRARGIDKTTGQLVVLPGEANQPGVFKAPGAGVADPNMLNENEAISIVTNPGSFNKEQVGAAEAFLRRKVSMDLVRQGNQQQNQERVFFLNRQKDTLEGLVSKEPDQTEYTKWSKAERDRKMLVERKSFDQALKEIPPFDQWAAGKREEANRQRTNFSHYTYQGHWQAGIPFNHNVDYSQTYPKPAGPVPRQPGAPQGTSRPPQPGKAPARKPTADDFWSELDFRLKNLSKGAKR